MGQCQTQFAGCQRHTRVGIGVSEYQHPFQAVGHEHLLQFDEHPAGLGVVGSGSDIEVDGCRSIGQLYEKDLRHEPVVVLAGVHQNFMVAGPEERLADRGGFDELRASANHRQHLHGAASRIRMQSPALS